MPWHWRAEPLATAVAASVEGEHPRSDRGLEHVALVRLRELVGDPGRRGSAVDDRGGHWGGGMYINALDMARFGYLTLRRGKWKDRQLLSEQWIARALTPTGPEPTYGFMNFFLNTNQKLWPSAPASAFAHIGNGTNLVYVDPEHDLVAVARWIDNKAIDGFLQKLIAAVENK